MKEQLTDNNDLLSKIIEMIATSQTNYSIPKEWLSLKEGAAYAGVSYNTFVKFREIGLKVSEVEGIKRVSRTEINTFFENYSF
ncbi:DNA-binding protein [Viridibacillus arvi]|uniref:DNA-binding protein n=1 Tax=Viridibacillus arvi TaxID=263475 RepID=UPI00187B1818|nr:DNA-binding protein [Viridibacillus sp. JNUCC-6]QOV13206.1 DNA-binding protein [Viridibacillus sp. JNUCC-6]